MGKLKTKQIESMNKTEIKEKLKELDAEMIKALITIKKAGKVNLREIKKTKARLLTFKNKIKSVKEAKK